MNAREVHQLYHQVVAVGGQEVHPSALLAGFVDEDGQFLHRCALVHARLPGHVGHAVHLSEPDDVLDVDVVADEPFPAFVGIQHAHQPFAVQAEVVEERRVLTELVPVGRVVDGRVVVAHEQDYPAPDALAQHAAALHVGLFVK